MWSKFNPTKTPNNDTVTETAKALAKVDPDFCASCELIGLFTTEAHGFVSWIGGIMQDGMINIFDSFLPLWALFSLFFILLGKKQISDFAREFIFIIITFIFLVNNGPGLVSGLYGLSLELIGTLGQVTFLTGDITPWKYSDQFISKGIVNLVWTVENSVKQVYEFAFALSSGVAWYAYLSIWLNMLIFIILPYIVVTTMFFSQMAMAIFRVILLSVFFPVIIFFVAFNWGREMGKTALKTLLASIFIAIASTAAMSLTVYMMGELIETITQGVDTKDPKIDAIWPALFMLASLAWMGIAFMAETTGIANSLAGSMLSNTGAAIMTTAISTMSVLGGQKLAGAAMGGAVKPAGRLLGHGLGVAGGAAVGAVASKISGVGTGASTISRLAEIARGPRKQ